jgi:hypothetical protein
LKEIQTFPEGNPRVFGRKSKENQKEIQAFVFRRSSLFNHLRRPLGIFFFKSMPASKHGGGVGVACSPAGCSSVLSVFVSGSSGLVKQVKGWRRF